MPVHDPLIMRSERPRQFETPVECLGSSITPNHLFFVRDHLGVPDLGPSEFRLDLTGELDRCRTFSLEELRQFDVVTLPATLQCSGNGRAFYQPPAKGTAWERGAIGNAEWTGVRLESVLRSAGLRSGARHVHFDSFDEGSLPDIPPWARSIPIERALDPTTLLAFGMNGEPLPRSHGGPLRLVVPGWTGNHWCKWVRRIAVRDREADGHFMRSAYRMPAVSAADQEIRENPLKSIILRPVNGTIVPAGSIVVSGVALTGTSTVERVEVSVNGSRWQPARLESQIAPGSWQLWRYEWSERRAGAYTLVARAFDSRGSTQPEVSLWNSEGYLWNGIDKVRCEVR